MIKTEVSCEQYDQAQMLMARFEGREPKPESELISSKQYVEARMIVARFEGREPEFQRVAAYNGRWDPNCKIDDGVLSGLNTIIYRETDMVYQEWFAGGIGPGCLSRRPETFADVIAARKLIKIPLTPEQILEANQEGISRARNYDFLGETIDLVALREPLLRGGN